MREIKEQIQKSNKIIICRHQRPDPDAIGSVIALKGILKKKYPQKEIYAYGEDELLDLRYIGKNDRLEYKDFDDALIIILDAANVERIEGDFKSFKRKNLFIIKIDHHPNVEPYGNINHVIDTKSSTSEMIYDIFIDELGYELDSISAKALFIGIHGDTGGFTYSNVSANTFRVASKLREIDFEYEEVNLWLKEKDPEIVQAIGWMYENIEIKDSLGIIRLDKKTENKLKIPKNVASSLVGYLGIFSNLKIWILFTEYDKFIRVNLRSKGKIDVSILASNYSGGGHKNASGAKVYNWDEAQKVIDEAQKLI